MKRLVLLSLIVLLVVPTAASAEDAAPDPETAVNKQCIVWTSGDREVALKLVYMYAANAAKREWMDHVMLLVWGPSAKLLSVDQELQAGLKELEAAGVELVACKACADLYGVSDTLAGLGIDVKYAGKLLADIQKDGWHVLTF